MYKRPIPPLNRFRRGGEEDPAEAFAKGGNSDELGEMHVHPIPFSCPYDTLEAAVRLLSFVTRYM